MSLASGSSKNTGNELFIACFHEYQLLDAATLSGTLKARQKLGVTLNSDKLGGIDFTKFSKLSMCSAAQRTKIAEKVHKPPFGL